MSKKRLGNLFRRKNGAGTEPSKVRPAETVPMKERKPYRTLFASMLSIGTFTFGGGAVIIPLMRKKMVEDLGWLSEEDLLDMVSIARSSPGAVSVNVAAQIGIRTAGVPGLILAVLAIVLPPFGWLTLISMFYDSFRTSSVVDAVLRSMQPAVAAVILCAAMDMLRSIRGKQKASGWLLFAAALVLGLYGVNVIWILLGGVAVGTLVSVWGGKGDAA